MSKSVWVIEQGSYSDYRVVGVFSSRENAELVAAAIHKGDYGDTPSVAKWDLDPAVDALNKGHRVYNVLMLRDGTVERAERREFFPWEIGGKVSLWRRSMAPAYRGTNTPDALNATVWAKDKKHAVKIVNEKRTQMIANGEWT